MYHLHYEGDGAHPWVRVVPGHGEVLARHYHHCCPATSLTSPQTDKTPSIGSTAPRHQTDKGWCSLATLPPLSIEAQVTIYLIYLLIVLH